MQLKYLFILILFITSNGLFAQITFDASVSKTKLGVNERLQIEFKTNKSGDNFSPPSFEGFNVIMGPSMSSNYSWINGKQSFTQSYTYTLAPINQGSFTIGEASIEIDDETYKSQPIKIQVTSAVEKPNSPETLANQYAEERVHLVTEVSKANPYLNEAVSVVYKLYVSPEVNVSNYNAVDNPKYNNFWSQEIKMNQLNVQNGTYKGQAYRFVILKKVVLYRSEGAHV